MNPRLFGDSATRVFLAILDGERTARGVAQRCRLASASVHFHLEHLHREGLVAWEPGKSSTIHALARHAPSKVGVGA